MTMLLIGTASALALAAFWGIAYGLAFNSRFKSWRDGRETWREMARLRGRRHDSF